MMDRDEAIARYSDAELDGTERQGTRWLLAGALFRRKLWFLIRLIGIAISASAVFMATVWGLFTGVWTWFHP